MRINDWPDTERPRERLLADGPASLSEAELLALLLHSGRRGNNAVELGRELLTNFGGLVGILGGDRQALCAHPGMGPGKVARLLAVHEIGVRFLRSQLHRQNILNSSAATRDFLRFRYRHCQREIFSCLFLNNQHHMVKLEELFIGTIDGAAVYPREVVKRCLHYNAAAVIFAHNHPSGIAEPSQADVAITAKLRAALDTIDVRVLDHLVIGSEVVVSLAERDLL